MLKGMRRLFLQDSEGTDVLDIETNLTMKTKLDDAPGVCENQRGPCTTGMYSTTQLNSSHSGANMH